MGCALCGEAEEDILRLFTLCPVTRSVGFQSQWGWRCDAWRLHSKEELINFCIDPPAGALRSGWEKEHFTTFYACLPYGLWNFRNERIFTGKMEIHQIVRRFEKMVDEFLELDVQENFQSTSVTALASTIKLNTDAAFSKGEAGIALVARDHLGQVQFMASKYIQCSFAALA